MFRGCIEAQKAENFGAVDLLRDQKSTHWTNT